jgi:HEAT repeat protein
MLSTEDRIKALIEDLRSLDPGVVEAAGNSLIEVGLASLPFLIDSLNDSVTYFRRNVGKVLVQFGEPALELLFQYVLPKVNNIYDYVHDDIIEYFALFGEKAILPLVEIMKAEIRNEIVGGIEFNCSWALKEIGEPAHNYLLSLIQDTDKYNRCTAACALGEFKDDKTLAALINALQDPFEGVKLFAAIKVGFFDSPEILPALQKALLETNDSFVKTAINDMIEQQIEMEKHPGKTKWNKFGENER